ncbi:hypothetical protein Bphyt_5349 [Paraburkholderia phytofirmans PsJN]|uniref:Uncharacterized protein n=1 Tax=Paraburkholderia phytofirmans (strain DSM 17436 / LMG 22146 / PsJN) TaxID=398527 RepID=B2TBQ6_PARPJ|nr:hypothetical protein Bphyt_5349 [Paraburkholderia phytofirmans PsJN]
MPLRCTRRAGICALTAGPLMRFPEDNARVLTVRADEVGNVAREITPGEPQLVVGTAQFESIVTVLVDPFAAAQA